MIISRLLKLQMTICSTLSGLLDSEKTKHRCGSKSALRKMKSFS